MHQGFWKAKWQSLSIFCGLYHYSGATEIPCGILSKSYLQLLNQVFVLIKLNTRINDIECAFNCIE